MIYVRRATSEDIDILVKFKMELLKEVGNVEENSDISILKKSTVDYFERKINNEFVSWVAEYNGQIIGISGLVILERPPVCGNLSGLEGYIMNMYIVPEHRGQGVATVIMENIINYMKKINCRRIWLHSSDKGRHLYEKLGFKSNGSEMELTW